MGRKTRVRCMHRIQENSVRTGAAEAITMDSKGGPRAALSNPPASPSKRARWNDYDQPRKYHLVGRQHRNQLLTPKHGAKATVRRMRVDCSMHKHGASRQKHPKYHSHALTSTRLNTTERTTRNPAKGEKVAYGNIE